MVYSGGNKHNYLENSIYDRYYCNSIIYFALLTFADWKGAG